MASVLLVLLSGGCTRALSIGELVRDRGDADDDGSVPDDRPVAPIDPVFSCAQRGPLWETGDGAQLSCGAASSGFHYALCTCPGSAESDLQTRGALRVDGFDSRSAAYAPGMQSGAIGLGGALYGGSGEIQIGGSLVIAGAAGAPLASDLSVGGQLQVQGPLDGTAAQVTVAGDAALAGEVRVGALSVAGTLTVPSDRALGDQVEAAEVVRAPVRIEPPCGCDQLLDVAALVDAAGRDNDNDAGALPEGASSLVVLDGPRDLSVPCGRYVLGEVNVAHPVTLRIEGRVALYVQGGVLVDAGGALSIELEGDAELDLFVRGSLVGKGPLRIGTPRHPTRTRLHFGGDLDLEQPSSIAAAVYAPRAALNVEKPLELYGALLVRRVTAAEGLVLHYDRALARDACEEASCGRDRDCPAPLRCDTGRCLP